MHRSLIACILLILALPAGSEESPPVPEEAVLADLPFLDRDPSHVWVDLSSDPERPLEVMLDTGANLSLMGKGTVRALGRAARDKVRFATATGKMVTFNTELSPSERDPGVVGHDFLKRFVVEFDYPARRVRFIDKGAYEAPETVDDPNEAVLPLHVRRLMPVVEMSLNGQSIRAIFDTGALTGLTLEPTPARKLGIEPEKWPVVGQVSLVSGPTPVRLVEPGPIQLDRFRFEGLPINLFVHDVRGLRQDAVLGPDILRHFVVRYDVSRRRVWLRLERTPTPATYAGLPYVNGRGTGALLYNRRPGQFSVLSLIPGSPAHLRGLHTRDVIAWEGNDPIAAFEAIHQALGSGLPMTIHRHSQDQGWSEVELGPLIVPSASGDAN